MTLLHDASDRLRRLRAACWQLARALREWYLRPSTRELRGLKLLREWLSREQLAQYDAHRYFDVVGNHTVVELNDAALPRTGWCFVPRDHLVAGDVMLAQKIALETDERGALAAANNFTPR